MAKKKKDKPVGVTKAAAAKEPPVLGPGALPVPAPYRSLGTTLSDYALHQQSGYFSGPDSEFLEKYEIAFRNDPFIHAALRYIARTMIYSIGPYIHNDPRAVKYVEEMKNRMQSNFEQQMYELILSALWSGFGVSEKIFEYADGKIWLKRLNNYHPRSIRIVPNDQGELVDRERLELNSSGFPFSGMWQELPARMVNSTSYKNKRFLWQNYVRLPLSKLVFVTHNKRHGNWAGESSLAPIWLSYQMVMETMQNLMITSERYGSPQVAAIVPHAFTSQQVVENGETRYLTVAEVSQDVLSNLSASSAVVFEEPIGVTATEKIRLETLSTFNNFGDSFLDPIKNNYAAILIGLGVPPLLFLEHSGGLGGGAIASVHAETYKQTLVSLYKEFVEPFCEQVIGQLLQMNFGIKDPGRFVFNPYDLSASSTIMQTFSQAFEWGVMDPTQEADLQWVRASLGIPAITQESIVERMKNNKRLLELKHNPDAEKTKQNREKNKTAVETATIAADASMENSKRTTDTQKYVAKLKPKPQAPGSKAKPKKKA